MLQYTGRLPMEVHISNINNAWRRNSALSYWAMGSTEEMYSVGSKAHKSIKK